MAKGRIRAKIRRSSLYTFSNARGEPAYKKGEGQATSTGPGYSRTIYINQPLQPPNKFCTNYVSTTKYSPLTFLPIALYEQFNRVANFYFLLAAFFTMTPMSPFSPVSQILPLSMVVGFSIAKELFEDLQRLLQDTKVNSRKASVHVGNGIFESWPWRKICVGDIIRVHKDEFFPADLLLLSSSYEDGICYVETMNLDGETNLKVKRALPSLTLPSSSTSTVAADNGDDEENDGAMAFGDFSATIQCESPNPNLYTFVGNLEYDGQVYPLDPAQLLLRDSKLRNTAYVYGVVIFTGRDSKVMQNAIKSITKRSNIERQMDKIIYLLFTLLFLISVVSALGSTWMTVKGLYRAWYLLPQETSNSPKKQFLGGFAHLVTALILYGYLIPISLYVSIEFVKILQVRFIDNDSLLSDEESGISAKARTSNLNEQLGQVDTILSDKTGTLTCNQMDFLKCSIAGCAYGKRLSEVELAAAKQMADMELENNAGKENGNDYPPLEAVTISGSYEKTPPIKGFSFEDDRLMNGNWSKEPNADVLVLFFRILAVCHTAIPEFNMETGLYTYEAESPDEGAFLVAAREFGFEFFKRTQTSIFVHEKLPPSQELVEKEYKVLHLLDFTSKRKRMSVIVQDENGEIILFCKGADTIIFDRLAKSGKMFIEDTTKHLNEYGEAGLRTLALSYRKLEEAEYASWSEEFHKAKVSIDADRDAMLEKLSDEMERELVLVGATAVEDKLQSGVPQCIDRLAQAGLKIWVLTGDKMETAINIGFSCSLLRQGMKQICVAVSAEMLAEDIKEVIKENVLMQINSAAQMIKSESDPHAAFALIIDGKTLTYALEDDMKYQFLNLAVNCASVICCRVSPKQKALVTRLVKEGTGKTTLGIGDGANDVGMIKEADLGVGISGVEGMQAVMASDFSIAQFRFLERLLVVHGHWCYKRIAKMICYFFYKNIAFGLTLFYFEAYTGFSGQSIYDNWFMLLFNVILTSLPVISLGVFEQDVSAEICLEFPALYNQGPRNLFFDWNRIFGWLLNGFYCSLVIFLLNIVIYSNQAFREQGQTPDLNTVGTAMFTSIIWAVNFQIFLITNYFTWIQQFLIWGSITMWYVLLYIYGALPIDISYNVYHILPEMLGPAVIYWITTLLVTVTSILPHLFHISYQRCTNPEDHHVIQEMKYYRKDVTDGQMWRREQSKARQETKIGITARVEAKLMHLKGKMQRYATSRAVAPMSVTT